MHAKRQHKTKKPTGSKSAAGNTGGAGSQISKAITGVQRKKLDADLKNEKGRKVNPA
jgi:hypothetical protein